MKNIIAIVTGLFMMAAGSAQAVVFTGSPSPSLSPTFGTLIDFDDQATGTLIGAGDYAAMGLASLTETTGSTTFGRYAGSQSQPNYIGTGIGYDIGGSDSGGWDGVFLFELTGWADMIGIGVADSRGDAEVLSIFDSSMNLLETTFAPVGANTYVGFDRTGSYDIKYLQVTCDFCALDDLQFHATVPEPSILMLLSLGLIGFGFMRRNKA